MLTRRQFLFGSAALAGWHAGCARGFPGSWPALVNDIHAQLNPTRVNQVVEVRSFESLRRIVRSRLAQDTGISIAGGRHAMGGQQFGAGTVLLDTRALKRVLRFDPERGEIEVEAGIQWPALIEYLHEAQRGRPSPWGIIQKQTGADRLTIGGALAANVHGRGLSLKPLVGDVTSFVLVGPDGEPRTCSRSENPELFRLAIGGYGLFGVITSAQLRLAPRQRLERIVEILDVEELMPAFERRIAEGFLFGDFQYATDESSDDFLRKGVFSCYRPVDETRPAPAERRKLSREDWRRLLYLAHVHKRRAFEEYAAHYLRTSGQLYWSDTHQLSLYLEHYHQWLDRRLGAAERATEMISEIYVPRPALPRFLADVRRDFRRHRVNLIYGTIRLIERDDESFLAWAKDRYVCIIFNLHVVHTPPGLARAAEDFRRLIDLALSYGGSYYLTYHRWATRQQVERSYPQFAEFLRSKRKHDPDELFQSDWYRHYRAMFSDTL